MKTLRWLVPCMMVVGLYSLGCDSNSSDDSDTTTPTQDTVSGDDEQGEPDIVAEDQVPGEDTSADQSQGCQDECQDGATQCAGTTAFMTCEEGADGCLQWSAQVNCAANQVCEAGACKDAQGCQDECTTLGAKECVGTTSARECVAGLDGCKDWKTTACAGTQTCENGACGGGGGPDGPGVEGCLAINECMTACGANQSCQQSCFTNGSAEGQAAYQAVAQCAQTNCAEFQTNQAAMSLCVLQECKTAYEGCFGANWGTDGCMAIMQCAGTCQDAACQQACIDEGSYEGMVALMVMQSCLGSQCATECGQGGSQSGCQSCATSKCMTEVMGCQNN